MANMYDFICEDDRIMFVKKTTTTTSQNLIAIKLD
jgi:hypothetical protein